MKCFTKQSSALLFCLMCSQVGTISFTATTADPYNAEVPLSATASATAVDTTNLRLELLLGGATCPPYTSSNTTVKDDVDAALDALTGVTAATSSFIGCIALAPASAQQLRMVFHTAVTASVEPLALINAQDCNSGWSTLCSTLTSSYSVSLTSATAVAQQLTCATSEKVVAVPNVSAGSTEMDNVIRLTSWAMMEQGGNGAADITDAPDFNGDTKALKLSTSASDTTKSYPSVSFIVGLLWIKRSAWGVLL